MDINDIRLKVDYYTGNDQDEFQAKIKEFIETAALYTKYRISPPPLSALFKADVAFLPCIFCKTVQPFREPAYRGMLFPTGPKRARTDEDLIQQNVYSVKLECTGCNRVNFYCYIFVDPFKDIVMKVGQFPMWLPKIPKELEAALGDDAELYQKALRNMNESYGIGACAYLRRLVEKYINPLLQLLHEIKKEEGAQSAELDKIEAAIKAREFAKKTEFAAEIAPTSIIVGGMNPLRKLHELLSDGLHNLDDDAAMDIAHQIRGIIEFVIPELRSHIERRKQYIQNLKSAGKKSP